MATKTFKGEVIRSEDGSFAERKPNPMTGVLEDTGMMIVGWSLVLMLNDDQQKKFWVSAQGVCYNDAKAVVSGNEVIVNANAQPGQGDRVKWVPVEIKIVDEPKF